MNRYLPNINKLTYSPALQNFASLNLNFFGGLVLFKRARL